MLETVREDFNHTADITENGVLSPKFHSAGSGRGQRACGLQIRTGPAHSSKRAARTGFRATHPERGRLAPITRVYNLREQPTYDAHRLLNW